MQSHQCVLESYAEEFQRLPKYASWKQKFKRRLQMSVLMSYYHPLARLYYRTYTAMRSARTQQAKSSYRYIIHPFSLYRQYWEMFMVAVLLTLLIVTPLNVAFFRGWWSSLVTVLNMFGMADIVHRFITGYTIDHLKAVVLDPRKIAVHYLKSCNFYLELIGAMPFMLAGWIACTVNEKSLIASYMTLFSLAKVSRIKSLLEYSGHTLEYWQIVDNWYMVHVKFLMLFLITMHWCGCLLIVLRLYNKLFAEHISNCIHWDVTWQALNPHNHSEYELYYEALFTATRHLFCITTTTSQEFPVYRNVVAYVFTSLIGYVFSSFALVLFVQMMFRINNSVIRYESVMNQLSKYMRHKQLPMKMQQRLIEYYEFSLRKSYCREASIFMLVSKRIRQEINMHATAMMAKKVAILKDLPDEVIGRIIAKMKPEVFLPNDTILVSGMEGNCMYFIYTGTVAVYSPTGKEICHLEDGSYFGEVSLMMPDRKCIANIVALEVTEVYRLDRNHFHQQIRVATPDLYRKMESIAERRRENTMVMEEIHRKQMLEMTMRINRKDAV